jgi:hypothetical protein
VSEQVLKTERARPSKQKGAEAPFFTDYSYGLSPEHESQGNVIAATI